MVRREASVMMEKGQVTSRTWRTGAEEKMCLSSLKAFCWRGVHFQGLFFLVKRFRGVTMLEKLGMNFQ